jgi:hypothetical protein
MESSGFADINEKSVHIISFGNVAGAYHVKSSAKCCIVSGINGPFKHVFSCVAKSASAAPNIAECVCS